MGWYVPFSRLSQTQVSVIEDITRSINKNNHFISGAAGSGKSVILMHVLERIAADNSGSHFVFLSYTHALVGMAKTALMNSGLDPATARQIRFQTVHKFIYGRDMADFVFVDETQDLQTDWLDKIKIKAKHVVLSGDFDQSIYDDCADYGEMAQRFAPKTHKLMELFRITQSLKKVAMAIDPSATEIVEADPVNATDADIRDVSFNSAEDEADWVVNEATTRARAGRPSALLFHHHRDVQLFYEAFFRAREVPLPTEYPRDLNERYINMNDAIKEANVPLSYYGNKVGTLNHGELGPHVYLMTMHSAKGLDFKNVFLPCLNRPPRPKNTEVEPFQRRVSFVGVTRTFENLFLSHVQGAMEAPFDNLPSEIVTKVAPMRPNAADDELFF
jgi:superfamily I DNA/RNA helicase